MKPFVFSEAINKPVTLKLIPRSQYMDTPICKDPMNQKSRSAFFKMLRKKKPTPKTISKGESQRSFSAAAWLSFDVEVTANVRLFITFEDESGEYQVVVDKSQLRGTKSVMLAGNADLTIQGDIKQLKIECMGLAPNIRCWVDDVYIQKKEASLKQSA